MRARPHRHADGRSRGPGPLQRGNPHAHDEKQPREPLEPLRQTQLRPRLHDFRQHPDLADSHRPRDHRGHQQQGACHLCAPACRQKRRAVPVLQVPDDDPERPGSP